MTLSVQYHPEARAEFVEAVLWYAKQRKVVGVRFRAAARQTVRSVTLYPESAPVWPGWDRLPVVRAVHLQKPWPYRVVYFVDDFRLQIVAVAHDKRLPRYWEHRV